MKKLVSVLMIAAIMAMGSTGVQSAPELIEICYYGVTVKVSKPLAQRYIKLGAKRGACGQDPCSSFLVCK